MAEKIKSPTTEYKTFIEIIKKISYVASEAVVLPDAEIFIKRDDGLESFVRVSVDEPLAYFYHWASIEIPALLAKVKESNIKVKELMVKDTTGAVEVFKNGESMYSIEKIHLGENANRAVVTKEFYRAIPAYMPKFDDPAVVWKPMSEDDILYMLEGNALLFEFDETHHVAIAKSLFPLMKADSNIELAYFGEKEGFFDVGIFGIREKYSNFEINTIGGFIIL